MQQNSRRAFGSGWRPIHAYADRLDRRFRTVIGRVGLAERAWVGLLNFLVARQSDRRYMRKAILPALADAGLSRILFVGVRGYTTSYEQVFKARGAEFWTCDIDPAAAVHGARGRHVTGDARRLDTAFRPASFDAVILNGLFGWGVDVPEDMDRVLVAAAGVLRPDGVLLIGWNDDRSPDPDTLPNIAQFAPTDFRGLPHRHGFSDVTHRYAWYRKRGLAAQE